MRNIKIAVLLALALCAGCSFSASLEAAQLQSELMPSVVVDNDDFRQVHNSTVRIRAYNNNQLEWMGSGLCYKIEDNRAFILSNQHVCGGADKITAECFRNGRSLGEFVMRVDLCKQNNDGIDVDVISCNIGKTLQNLEAIPFSNEEIKAGDEVYFCGAARGEWPKGKLGRVIEVTADHFYSNPTSIPGDSGSSMIRFNEDGEPEIVGLVAWYSTIDGKRVCMSMRNHVVLGVLAGGEIPEIGDAPPSNLETERLIQSILERLREMRQDNKREREGLLNRLSQMQMEHAMAQEESKRLLDLFKKQQDEKLDRIEEKEDGLTDKIMGQFTTLKQMVTLAKYAFYALVAALLISIFAGQGWLSRVIVTIFKLLFHGIRGAITIVLDAVAKPIKETNSPKEALDNLREEIGDAIEDES